MCLNYYLDYFVIIVKIDIELRGGDLVLTELIDVSQIENLLSFNAMRIDTLEANFIDEYYNNIGNNDVDFLSKNRDLDKLSDRQKMIVYHSTIMEISTIALSATLAKHKIIHNNKELKNIFPFYNEVANNFNDIILYSTFLNTNTSDVEELLITTLTDNITLVSRKSSGSEITPKSIVDFMLDSVGYDNESVLDSSILEPACGTGRFISQIIKRIISQDVDKTRFLQLIADKKRVVAYDINPLNTFISKIIVTLNFICEYKSLNIDDVVYLFKHIPFVTKDVLREEISGFDFVIGNPPYIRLQNLPLETRNYIKDNYISSTGRYDAYVCFIEAAIKSLKNEGKFSFITSNKYFTANYGVGIRNFIANNLEVSLLFDLTDTKYFEAAVLPAIISGEKCTSPVNSDVPFCHIKMNTNDSTSAERIDDIFKFTLAKLESKKNHKGNYIINNHRFEIPVEFAYSKVKIPKSGEQWNFSSSKDDEIKAKIEDASLLRLSDIFDICVGIKTTADTVFVKPMTKDFILKNKFENELMHPLIQSFNVERWKIKWDENNKKDRFILFPHIDDNGKTKAVDLSLYPMASQYLHDNEEILKARKYLAESKTRQWYECWVPQTLEKFKKKKIVTRDIVSHNSFAIDFEGRLCQGNTFFLDMNEYALSKTGFSGTEEDFLFYILGILNSNVLEYYQKLISGSLYSKKYRYTTGNLSRWPIRKFPNNEIGNRIIEIVKRLIESGSTYKGEEELNELIYSLYGLTSTEVSEIESFLKSNT